MTDLLSSLKTALLDAENLRLPAAQRDLHLTLLQSHSRRCHSLFPWASNLKNAKVYMHDILLSVSEQSLSSTKGDVPTFGLELMLFHLPNSNLYLLYVSKADTTGIFSRASVAKIVTSHTLAWFAQNYGPELRIHVLARAAAQYLYPGSADNPHKHVLSDKKLCAWWKQVLSLAAKQIQKNAAASPLSLSAYFSIPGSDELEARRITSSTKADEIKSGLEWVYSHPYTALPPICAPATSDSTPTLGDLIPAFPDDPKSRFLTSLTSSPMSPAGEPGDYEDAYKDSNGRNDVQLEEQREVERARLAKVEGGIDEFWERLAYRQECSSGAVVGFFVLALKASTPAEDKAATNGEEPSKRQAGHSSAPSSISHHTYTTLWNTYHNISYSLVNDTLQHKPVTSVEIPKVDEEQTEKSIARLAALHEIWHGQIHAAVLSEAHAASSAEPRMLEDATFVSIVLPEASKETGEKRKADESVAAPAKANVMMLKPRKKVKT